MDVGERGTAADAVRGLFETAGTTVVVQAGNDLDAVANRLIVLEEGVSCLCSYTAGGIRRITAFHFPGDYCNLHRYISPAHDDDARISAVTDCSFRLVVARDLREGPDPSADLKLHLFIAALREIRISRQWLLNLPRPAIQRVAHLLCELHDRQQASGVAGAVIPLTQIDLADATGLSAVHMNRTIQELRTVGVLTGNHHLELADRKHLNEICGFDGAYLE